MTRPFSKYIMSDWSKWNMDEESDFRKKLMALDIVLTSIGLISTICHNSLNILKIRNRTV